MNRKKENEIAEKYVEELKVRTPSIETVVGTLSGGNQQKDVISKAIILISDEIQEVMANCNRVLVMAHGKCVVELSEEDLMQEGADKHLAEIIGNQKEKALSQEVAQ